MVPETVQEYFERASAHGYEPRLRDTVGTCVFEIEGTGSWSLIIDQGRLSIKSGAADDALCRLALGTETFMRIARGEDHDNLTTALLRGKVRVHGDLRFGMRLFAILPMPPTWSEAS